MHRCKRQTFLQLGWCRTLPSHLSVSPLSHALALYLAGHALSPAVPVPLIVPKLHLSFSPALFLLQVTTASRPRHDISSRLICQLGEALVFSLSAHRLSLGRAPSLVCVIHRSRPPVRSWAEQFTREGCAWPEAQPRCGELPASKVEDLEQTLAMIFASSLAPS